MQGPTQAGTANSRYEKQTGGQVGRSRKEGSEEKLEEEGEEEEEEGERAREEQEEILILC